MELIDRQAAIDAMDVLCQEHRYRIPGKRETYSQYNEAWQDALDRAENAIFNLPSAQRWIPCSERLPDDLAEVNVTWVNHEPESYYDFMKDKSMTATAVYYRGKWYWFSCLCTNMLAEYGKNPLDQMDDAIEVIAWMPLPEPYGGEKE